MKILVIDDNPVSLRLLEVAVTNKGHQAISAADGPEALALLKEHGDIGLVLCDVLMPSMTGLEVLEAVKQGWDVPVMMVTGAGDSATIRAALAAGCDDYLLKPINTVRLAQKIDAMLAA